MTDTEKELWLCEFHDAFDRGDFDRCREMELALQKTLLLVVQLCKMDPEFVRRLVVLVKDWHQNREMVNK